MQRGHRQKQLRRSPRGWLVVRGLVSAAVVVMANREPLSDYPDASVNDYWSHDNRLAVLALFLLPVIVAVLSPALALPVVRSAAAAAIAVLGIAGFSQLLGFAVSVSGDYGYGSGLLLGLLGYALTVAAGVQAGFGVASDPPWPLGPVLPRVVGAIAFVMLVMPLPYLVHSTGSATFGVRYYLPLAILLAVAAVMSRALRHLTPLAGGSALAATGLAIGLTYADLLGGGFDPLDLHQLRGVATDLVFVAALGLAVVGVLVILRFVQEPPPAPTDAATDVGAREDGASEATRHLCAAMHLDDALARRVMQDVVDGAPRAIAPSLGIDLGVVVRHCLIARHRQRARDAVLICVVALALLQVYLLLGGQGAAFGRLLLLLLVGWSVVAVERIVARNLVARRLTREAFAQEQIPLLDDAEERKVSALEHVERGNVTAFGAFFPFVGSGIEVGGWSFALSVLKGAEGIAGEHLEPLAFEVDTLYEKVREDIDHLGVEGLTVEDRLYVDGEDLATDARFLDPGPPLSLRTELAPDQLGQFVRAPERVNRVYRCIRIYGWDGEFVLSIYLNFSRVGRALFAEARYFLLLPPKPEFVAHGKGIVPLSWGSALITAAASIRSLPGALVRAVRGVEADVRALWQPPVLGAGSRGSTVANLGATTSLRELAQGTVYRRYFQRLDREMTTKIVERQLLDSIAGFLREHQVDTSELQERQTAILNYGLIMSGGTMTAESVAVGQGAQSLISRIGAAIRAPREEGAAT